MPCTPNSCPILTYYATSSPLGVWLVRWKRLRRKCLEKGYETGLRSIRYGAAGWWKSSANEQWSKVWNSLTCLHPTVMQTTSVKTEVVCITVGCKQPLSSLNLCKSRALWSHACMYRSFNKVMCKCLDLLLQLWIWKLLYADLTGLFAVKPSPESVIHCRQCRRSGEELRANTSFFKPSGGMSAIFEKVWSLQLDKKLWLKRREYMALSYSTQHEKRLPWVHVLWIPTTTIEQSRRMVAKCEPNELRVLSGQKRQSSHSLLVLLALW